MQETLSPQAPGEEAPIRSSLWRLQGIFFEPADTFDQIRRRPTFWVALILMIVLSLITWSTIAGLVDLEDLILRQIEASGQADQLSEEQMRTQVQFTVPLLKYVGPIVGPPLMMLAISGVLMLVVYLSGYETGFKKMLGVVAHVLFFQTVVSSVLMISVFAASSSPAEINLQNPMMTNPGHFFSPETSPILYKLASSLDLIVWYSIFLLGLGLSKICGRMSRSTGFILVALPYLLYVMVGTAWAAFTG